MESDGFEWDDAKAEANLRKHKVSFAEGQTVFNDLYSIVESDEGHALDEARWTATGLSEQGRVLLVVFTMRGERSRIISAREPTPAERSAYESQF